MEKILFIPHHTGGKYTPKGGSTQKIHAIRHKDTAVQAFQEQYPLPEAAGEDPGTGFAACTRRRCPSRRLFRSLLSCPCHAIVQLTLSFSIRDCHNSLSSRVHYGPLNAARRPPNFIFLTPSCTRCPMRRMRRLGRPKGSRPLESPTKCNGLTRSFPKKPLQQPLIQRSPGTGRYPTQAPAAPAGSLGGHAPSCFLGLQGSGDRIIGWGDQPEP